MRVEEFLFKQSHFVLGLPLQQPFFPNAQVVPSPRTSEAGSHFGASRHILVKRPSLSVVASAKSAFDSMRVKPSNARTSRMRSTSTVSSKKASKPFGGSTRLSLKSWFSAAESGADNTSHSGSFRIFAGPKFFYQSLCLALTGDVIDH